MRIKESKADKMRKEIKQQRERERRFRDNSVATGDNPENRCFPKRQHTLMSSIVIGPFSFPLLGFILVT